MTPTTGVPSSNAAKTRNPLKYAGVPQTRQQFSAVIGPKFPYYEDMWRRYWCLTSFFRSSLRRYSPKSCAMVPRWRFLRPVFSASRVHHISDMHSKFALRPGSMVGIQSPTTEIRRGKKEERKKDGRNHRRKI